VLYRDRPQVFTNRHAVEGYQAALRRHDSIAPNVTLSYGGEAFRDQIASNNLGDHQRNYGAVYLAMDVRALKRYSFTLGGREEIFKGGARQFNPTAAFGAWISPHWKLRASASRAFRLPSYTDLYYHDPANIGSPYLKPESAWAYDAAAEWNAGKRIHGDFGVFIERVRNGIDFIRQSPTDLWRATNFDRLNFTGVDASVTVRSVEFRYTGLHGAQGVLSGLASKYVFNYPTHNGTITWQALLPAGFIARTRIGVLKRFERDPYALWDVSLANRHGRWSPFVQLTNITSTRYQEIQGIVMPTRSILGGIDWKFNL
jgi:iron complex outermembrane recepter protein